MPEGTAAPEAPDNTQLANGFTEATYISCHSPEESDKHTFKHVKHGLALCGEVWRGADTAAVCF